MDLIYIILISVAVVSFIVGFIIDNVQKRQNYNIDNESVSVEKLDSNNSDKVFNPTVTLQIKVDNDKDTSSSEPVIISSVVLESYDDEIL